MRAIRTTLAGAVLGLLPCLLWTAPAAAHAVLLNTDPADGAVLPDAPAELRLAFNEPVQVRDGAIKMFDAAGAAMKITAHAVDTEVVIAPPADLADGTYVVSWRVISADSHPVAGGFTFSVGAPNTAGVAVPGAAEPTTGLRVLRTTVEAAGYLGVLAVVGLVGYWTALLPTGSGGTVVRRRVRIVMLAAGGITVLALVVQLPVTAAWQDGAGLGALLDTGMWRSDLGSDTALAGLLTVAGLAAAVAAAMGRFRLSRPTAFAGGALALGALALVGHTRTFGPAWLVLPADLLHVTTGAVWFGGLIGLAITLLPSSGTPAETGAEAVARFSRVAGWLVLALAVAGVLLGWRIVHSWSALFNTAYGLSLLAKVGIAGVILAIAAYNRLRLVPRVTDTAANAMRLLRRTVRLEAGLLAAVVAVTGFLVTQSPLDTQTPAAASNQAPSVEAELGSGTTIVRVSPGTVGVNSLELTIVDSARQPVEPVESPTLRVTQKELGIGPLDRKLSRTGPGRYEAVSDFPLPGRWTLDLSVRTSKYDNPVVQIQVDIR